MPGAALPVLYRAPDIIAACKPIDRPRSSWRAHRRTQALAPARRGDRGQRPPDRAHRGRPRRTAVRRGHHDPRPLAPDLRPPVRRPAPHPAGRPEGREHRLPLRALLHRRPRLSPQGAAARDPPGARAGGRADHGPGAGSGVWLLLAGPRVRDTVLPIHKVSFIVWLCLTSVHVLGHVLEVPSALSDDYSAARRARAAREGRLAESSRSWLRSARGSRSRCCCARTSRRGST